MHNINLSIVVLLGLYHVYRLAQGILFFYTHRWFKDILPSNGYLGLFMMHMLCMPLTIVLPYVSSQLIFLDHIELAELLVFIGASIGLMLFTSMANLLRSK